MVLTYFLLGVTIFALITGFISFKSNKYLQKQPCAIVEEKTDPILNRTTYILKWEPYLKLTTLCYKKHMEFEDEYSAKYVRDVLNGIKSSAIIKKVKYYESLCNR